MVFETKRVARVHFFSHFLEDLDKLFSTEPVLVVLLRLVPNGLLRHGPFDGLIQVKIVMQFMLVFDEALLNEEDDELDEHQIL